jgi:hypothetical protein
MIPMSKMSFFNRNAKDKEEGKKPEESKEP